MMSVINKWKKGTHQIERKDNMRKSFLRHFNGISNSAYLVPRLHSNWVLRSCGVSNYEWQFLSLLPTRIIFVILISTLLLFAKNNCIRGDEEIIILKWNYHLRCCVKFVEFFWRIKLRKCRISENDMHT